MNKVLIATDRSGVIVSATSLACHKETLGADLQYLAAQNDLEIHVVVGPVTIGGVFITTTCHVCDKLWIAKCDSIFGTVPPDCWLQDGCGTERCTCEYQKWQCIKKELKD